MTAIQPVAPKKSLAPIPAAQTLELEVNGRSVAGEPEGRTSLADFLREELDLTGTHLGCEHGVCGACTVELDGAPVRSCITVAHACHGRRVRTIEGYDDDAVMAALRNAFSEFHGLQCGFCTPGMLIACRDMILRYDSLSEEQIRVALGGNICRCTGYVGIVQAVKSVFARRRELAPDVLGAPAPPQDPLESFPEASMQPLPRFQRSAGQMRNAAPPPASGGDAAADDQKLYENVTVARSPEEVWDFMRDVERVVPCIPGAKLLKIEGDSLDLEMEIALGAIRARFRGEGRFSFEDEARRGRFEGQGRDARSGSTASGVLEFAVLPGSHAQESHIELVASYGITGALSQFSRGGLVKSFVGAIAHMFGDNVQRVLAGGETSSAAPAKLNAFGLALSAVRHWLKELLRK